MLNIFIVHTHSLPTDGNRLTYKKEKRGYAYLSRRDDQVPTHEHKHTHAKRREHLMCLLYIRVLINLVVLLDK